MKRLGYQIEKIADPDNLRLAFWKAKKGKSYKPEVIDFQENLHENLTQIRQHMLNGTVEFGNYHYFTIFDPKERQICAASFPERVIHHAMMNVCHPHFEQYQIYHSYATRTNKGTHRALIQAQKNSRRFDWYLKMDVRKYFDSIDHGVLLRRLDKMYTDPHLMALFHQLIDTYHTNPGKGLPIGNLTSQYFANHYLAQADHYALEYLDTGAYIRYMDDVVIWHNDKAVLQGIQQEFEHFLNEKLQLQLKPQALNRTHRGIPYLGYLVFPFHIKLARRSRRRYIEKIKNYEGKLREGIWSQKEFQQHVLPLTAFTQHAQSREFRNAVLQN